MLDARLRYLQTAVIECDPASAELWAKKAIEGNIDPIEALDALTEAIRFVGDGFAKGERWLPDLVGAAEAMMAATPILEEEIKRKGGSRETIGTVVIGTVFGDIHTIGKTMVTTLLKADGLKVVDLGVNIKAEQFLEAVEKYEAQILAMSALMTTTAPEISKVINNLKERGLRDKVKIMVGGGGISREFADSIGADGYEPTAPGAVKLARRLLGEKSRDSL